MAARRAVSARAYPEADRYYALAIELGQWLPESGPGLLEEAAQVASWAGDPGRAAGWAAQALGQSGDGLVTDRAGCWNGSGVTTGKRATSTPPSMPPSRR